MTTAHRMTFWRFRIAAAAGATFALVAILISALQFRALQAQSGQPMLDVKLGLWEATTTSASQGMPQIDTSNMTPQQKAMYDAYVAQRAARGNTAATHTSKSCLTKDKLEKGFLDDPARQNQPQCKPTIASNSATELHLKVDCTAQGQPVNGDFHFVALSRESVKGDITMVIGGNGGLTSKSTMTAKWLGADCGDVK